MERSRVQYHLISQRSTVAVPNWCCSKFWIKLSRCKLAIGLISILSCLFLFFSCFHLDNIHSARMCLFLKTTNTSKNIKGNYHSQQSERRLPKCLIIGARKAGTRALLQFMYLHPKVQVASYETHYFDNESKFKLGLEWYRHQMPSSTADQITMEKTPAYFTNAAVPQRVHNMNSSMKILLIVRDPVQRAISDYAQLLDNKVKRNLPAKSFEELAIDTETGEVNKSYVVVKRSIYHRHLQKWLHFFPLKQIHIVDGDKFRVAPWEEVYKVESYLGLEHRIDRDQFSFSGAKALFCPKTKTGQERCLASGKGRKHPEVNFNVIQKLKKFYQPENEIFYRLINRRFTW